jgi:hypothetical protein
MKKVVDYLREKILKETTIPFLSHFPWRINKPSPPYYYIKILPQLAEGRFMLRSIPFIGESYQRISRYLALPIFREFLGGNQGLQDVVNFTPNALKIFLETVSSKGENYEEMEINPVQISYSSLLSMYKDNVKIIVHSVDNPRNVDLRFFISESNDMENQVEILHNLYSVGGKDCLSMEIDVCVDADVEFIDINDEKNTFRGQKRPVIVTFGGEMEKFSPQKLMSKIDLEKLQWKIKDIDYIFYSRKQLVEQQQQNK